MNGKVMSISLSSVQFIHAHYYEKNLLSEFLFKWSNYFYCYACALGNLITEKGWFAARPSGTEDIYKIYAESFSGKDHLKQIIEDAQNIVNHALEMKKQTV